MTFEDKNGIKYESLSKYLPSKRINIVVNTYSEPENPSQKSVRKKSGQKRRLWETRDLGS